MHDHVAEAVLTLDPDWHRRGALGHGASQTSNRVGSRSKMHKCTFCAGGPEKDHSSAEFQKYGRNRLAEGKLPLCAKMSSTKSTRWPRWASVPARLSVIL